MPFDKLYINLAAGSTNKKGQWRKFPNFIKPSEVKQQDPMGNSEPFLVKNECASIRFREKPEEKITQAYPPIG